MAEKDVEVVEETSTELVPVDVEVVEPEVGVEGPSEQQLEFEFADSISDAAWGFRVDARKRALDQVMKGFVALGFNHTKIANVLISLQDESKELELALVELSQRVKGQKG